jgi:tape measure domain-containing protein
MTVKGGKLEYETSLDTKGMQKGLNGLKASTVAIGNLIADVFRKVASVINDSMDTAIKRFDTLNNFSKVMSNLGISAEDSQKSIDKLSEKLMGLPTTLQDGAMAVQRFTSANGDIKKSTDYFLALNNAILAGGASTEIQATALEQLSQAYAKGKPDMMEWRSALTAMPAQLKQVAEAMGYVNAEELGEALRKGDVSMEDFMKTIEKLNTEGINGLANFEEQARNATGGIETAITNMRSRVAQGVEKLIRSIDDGLKDADVGGVADFILGFGNTMRDGLANVGETIKPIITGLLNGSMDAGEATKIILDKIMPIVKNIIAKIPDFVKQIFKTIIQMLPEILQALIEIVESIAKMLPELIPVIIEGIYNIIAIIARMLPTLITDVVNGILDALMSILDNIDLLIDAGIELIIALAEGIVEALPIIIDKMPMIIEKLYEAFERNLPKILEAGMKLIKILGNGIKNALPEIIKLIPVLFEALKKATINLLPVLGKIGLDIVKGIGNGIVSTLGLSWIKEKIKELVGNIVKNIKDFFKIGSPSKLMAQEVGQWLPKGIAVGIEANTDSIEKAMDNIDDLIVDSMNNAVNFKNGAFNDSANLLSNYNLNGDIIIQGNLESSVMLDGRKVGQETAPYVMKAIKNGGI